MKYLLLLLLSFPAFAQQGPTYFRGNLGTSGPCGRPDATLCVQSPTSPGDDQLHSNLTIDLSLFPCNPLAEALLNFQGRDVNNNQVQMGSVSVLFTGGCGYNGYTGMRLNSPWLGFGSDMAYRQWGGRGVGLFRPGDNDTCGGRFLCITRTSGYPSIAGSSNGMVIEGCFPGNCDTFLNSYGAGDVRLALGGGQVQIGTASIAGGCTPNARLPIKVGPGVGTLVYLPICQ